MSILREERLWRALVLSVASLFGVLSFSSRSHADATTAIDISDGFPSDDLPLGTSFVIEKKAIPAVTDAYGIFFEYAYGVFGSKAGSEIDYCSEFPRIAQVKDAKLDDQSPGDTSVASLFELAPDQSAAIKRKWVGLGKRVAFLLPAWHAAKATEGDPPPIHLRVPKTSFFKRGAHYCFVLVERRKEEKESTVVTDLLRSAANELGACLGSGAPSNDTQKQCVALAAAALTRSGKGLPAAQSAALRDNMGPAVGLILARRRLVAALTAEFQAVLPNADSQRDRLVEASTKLTPDACASPPGQPFLRREVTAHSFTIVTKGPKAEVKTDCDLAKLEVAKGLFLTDVFGFARKAVRGQDGWLGFDELGAAAVDKGLLANPEAFVAYWKEVGAALQPFDVLETAPAAGDPRNEVKSALRDWANAIDPAWVAVPGKGPMLLAAKVNDFVRALEAWAPKATLVKVIVSSTRLTVVDVSLGLNPKTWVFSFLTPTVGYATTSDSFGVPTLALQLYFFPNSADEPMWSNGHRDLRRLFSLELGIAPKTSSFGPNDRYSGPGDLPPLFAGVGVHLIPYTVLSGGCLFADAKRTTLPTEEASLHPVFYVGMSVQTNIPDIVSVLVSGKESPGE